MVVAWLVHLKGAVYVTSFIPLQIVISVALGAIFLGDTLHVGRYIWLIWFMFFLFNDMVVEVFICVFYSIIGATIISIGLYAVMWGKVTEEDVGDTMELPSTENIEPLLQVVEPKLMKIK